MRPTRVLISVIAGLALGACTSSTTPPPHRTTTGVVGWISTPAPPTTSTTTTTTTLAPAPFCTKAELRVQLLGAGAAAGTVSDEFQLTNIGKSTCRLQGQPKLFASTIAGEHMPSVVRHGYLPSVVVPGNLVPGASGYVIIWGTDNCPSPPGAQGTRVTPVPYKYVMVVLPSGEGSFITSKIPPCVPMSVNLGVEPFNPYLAPPVPGTLGSLQVIVELPKRIVGGRVLHFVVVLANRGAMAVPLKPCPGYEEGIYPWGESPPPLQRSYQLNCGRLRVLAPHHRLRFAMELPIPKYAQPLPVRFGWDLITGNGPWTDTLVTVYP